MLAAAAKGSKAPRTESKGGLGEGLTTGGVRRSPTREGSGQVVMSFLLFFSLLEVGLIR